MKILIAGNEQLPYFQDKKNNNDFPGLDYEFAPLRTGDYSIKDMSSPSDHRHTITIERKSGSDLFSSFGRGRIRLEKEFHRMSYFTCAYIVSEIDAIGIFKNPPQLSSMNPKSVYRSLLSWCMRYNVHWIPCHDRAFAEKTTFILLKRFYDDYQNNGKMNI